MEDRALVTAMTGDDPRGLDGAYRRYAGRLHAYAAAVVGPADAADVVHDTFVLASQRVGQLRDPDRLRPWLYAIARNECRRLLQRRTRIAPLEAAGEPAAEALADPADGLHAAGVVELVRSACAGLADGDREIVELAIRHGMAAGDIAAVCGISVRHAHARLSRARTQLAVALGVLLVARTGQERCTDLAGLLSGWDGRLTPLLRKRLHRHIGSCRACTDQRRRTFDPASLLAVYAALPFAGAAAGPGPSGLELSLSGVSAPELSLSGVSGPEPSVSGADGPPPSPGRAGRRASSRTALAVLAVAVAAAVCAGPAVLAVATPTDSLATASSAGTWLEPERGGGAPAASAPVPVGAGAAGPAPGGVATDGPDGSDDSPPPGGGPGADPTPGGGQASPAAPAGAAIAALTVTAVARVACTGGRSYTLVVTATANAAITSATLGWRTAGTGQRPMAVSGRSATAGLARLTAQRLTWWVEVVDAAGRRARSPVGGATNPCP